MTAKPARRAFVPISRGSPSQREVRKTLVELFEHCPLGTTELLTNVGLFVRSSVLSTTLYLNELYQRIVEVPGVIMEFGCWLGKNLTLCESLRAIYEPYNYTRRIIGFDTFAGYPTASKRDPRSRYLARGGYTVPRRYVAYLRRLLEYHERENPMAHIKKHEVVVGDARRTLPAYLKRNPQTIVALAYFDLALYEPTKRCLDLILPCMVPGSVIALDQLNVPEFAGETMAFREVLQQRRGS